MSFANKRFGHLTILREMSPDVFLCKCDCGNNVEVFRSVLANNVKRHCGCLTPENVRARQQANGGGLAGHARSYTTRAGKKRQKTSAEHNSWKNMKERCYGTTKPEYPDYGGRGIRVCERWLIKGGQGFRNFLADLGPRPSGKTLDRINPQGHYEPTNCQWADRKEQRLHQGRVIWVHCEPPPVEDVAVMEARIAAETEELMPY